MQNEIAGFSYYFYRIIVELKFEDSEIYSCIIFAVFFSFSRGNFCVIILREFYLSLYVTSLFSLNYAYVSYIFSIAYNLVLRLK